MSISSSKRQKGWSTGSRLLGWLVALVIMTCTWLEPFHEGYSRSGRPWQTLSSDAMACRSGVLLVLGKPSRRIALGGLAEHLEEFVVAQQQFGPVSGRELLFSLLPAWISPQLSQLCKLTIKVVEVRQQDMDILGSLPRLCRLILQSKRQSRLLRFGADGFHGLTSFVLTSDLPGQVVFQPGAMPKTGTVTIDISLQVAKEEAAGVIYNCFGLGAGNLPSLLHFNVKFCPSGMTVAEAKLAKAAVKNALRAHLNHQEFNIHFQPSIPSYAHDDDVC